MNNRIFHTLIFCFFISSGFSQGWEKVIDTSSAGPYSIFQAIDGNILVQSDKGITILNNNGDIINETQLPERGSGTFLFKKTENNYWAHSSALNNSNDWNRSVIALDKDLNISFESIVNNAFYPTTFDVSEKSNIYSFHGDRGIERFLNKIEKSTSDGDFIWETGYQYNSNTGRGIADIEISDSENLVILKEIYVPDPNNPSGIYGAIVDAFDRNGNHIVSDTLNHSYGAQQIHLISDSTMVLRGPGSQSLYDFKNKALLWEEFNETLEYSNYSLLTKDGGILLFLDDYTNSLEQGIKKFLKKISSDGKVEWKKQIDVQYLSNAHSTVNERQNYQIQTSDGGYAYLAIDNNQLKLIKTDEFGCVYSSQINGQVIFDQNHNCQFDSTETGIRDIKITSLETGREVITDEKGNFIIPSHESYHGLVFEAHPKWNKCVDTFYINVNNFDTVDVKIPFRLNPPIIGSVLRDIEDNCILTNADTPLDSWNVIASNSTHTFYATTNADGSYSLPVFPGDYNVEVITPNLLFEVCSGVQTVSVIDFNDVGYADFLVKDLFDCPLMEVNTSFDRLRRCFDNNKMHIQYCNQGTTTAADASLKITLDPFMSIVDSPQPFTQNGDTLIFPLSDVESLECRNFDLTFMISCDAVLGQAICTKTHIFPDSLCTTPSTNWSGASLQITGECTGDSIHFSIKNVGIGTMTEAREYIVIEDAAIMRVSNPFTLGAGGERTGSIATNGSTIRIEVEQEDNHPGESMPSITIERCGTGPFSSGFVTQLPLDDADPFVDIQCEQVHGSYDPNDKQAEPKGFSSEHFIDQNIDLEYTIRFQNTGNDTAFTVEIIDTISQLLDVASINPGVSSHDYRFEVFETGILRFTFNDILLVDSFTNEPASNGFVKYSIAQKEDVPLGSVIYNAADIYFDFNAPIYTNQTFHTVGRDFITVKTQEVFVPGAVVNVYPNPFNDKATFEIKNVAEGQKTLRLLDISGRVIYSQTVHHEQFILERKNLNSGFYFYEILGEGAKIATGKLVVE